MVAMGRVESAEGDAPLVRVLGRIEVRASGEAAWTEPPPQQRWVLALLASGRGRPCRVDRLVDALWGDEAPSNARRLVQGIVSRLRSVLEPSEERGKRLRTVPGGWQLDVPPETVDLTRFEDLVRDARQRAERGDTAHARSRVEEANALWQGPPFAELGDEPPLMAETRRLEEERLGARELLLELRMRDAEHGAVVGELQELVSEHPLRERAWGLLMEALSGAGRQADALAAYESLRQRLVEELGTEPGPELQRLHTAILRGGTPASAAPAEASPRRSPVSVSWPCRRDLPLVGRDDDLERLREAFERAREGPQAMFVSGEPGAGKTRLVAELADVVARRGAGVLVGRCTAGAAIPYQPFVEALRADAEATPDEQLEGRLGRYPGELARLLPELVDRTGLEPAPSSESLELDQHRLFDAVAGWLEAASSEAPLVVALEDLHASARPTLLLLRHVVGSVQTGRLLLVATYRDVPAETSAELTEALAELGRHPNVGHVEVRPLALEDVDELVRRSLKQGEAPQEGTAGRLHAATGGNALFVQELFASLEDGGRPDRVLDGAEIPRTIRQLLEARVSRLDDTTVRFLEQAAVAGEAFRFSVVVEAASVAEEVGLDALEEGTRARLVVTTDPTREGYAFSHGIMRDALLARTTPARRLRLHARLAEALERLHEPHLEAVVGDLAYHYAEAGPAGNPAKALAYAEEAGHEAMRQLAFAEAAGHYERALELLDGQDASDERRCDLLTALGEAQQRAGPGVHRDTLLGAIELSTKLGDAQRVARAAWGTTRGHYSHFLSVDEERVAALERALQAVGPETPGPRATLLALLASALTFAEDRSRPRRLSDEAVALARRAGDDLVLARVLTLRQPTTQDPSTLPERRRDTAELMEIADRLGDPALRIYARWWRAFAGLEAGDRPVVDRCTEEACDLSEEVGEPFLVGASLTLAVNRGLAWGDLGGVLELAERYVELQLQADASDSVAAYWVHRLLLHRELGDLHRMLPEIEEVFAPYFEGWPVLQAMMAWSWSQVGRAGEALEVLERFAEVGFDRIPFNVMWLPTVCSLSEVAAAAGREAEAKALLEMLAPYADRFSADVVWCTGSVSRYLGRLATALGDWDQAESYLDRASEHHAGIGAERLLNRTRLAQVELLLARDAPGDREAAAGLLEAAETSARREGQGGVEARCRELGEALTLDPR